MTGLGEAEREWLGELFERTLTVPPGGRAAFLADACGGNTRLHEELTSLLASHAEAPDFLSQIESALAPAVTGALSDPVLAAGTTIGHYEIIESLGSGGMGVVYKARDLTLDRLVALKFLPSHLSADASARARLKREARAASSLDHPNIAVVYEIGETESSRGHPESGRVFIAMACYEGETLKDKIARGRLSIREALDYAIQLADALARAHGAGIVHRDIKPANVMVTESAQVKIVDFGVAKSAGSTATGEPLRPDVVETGADLTREGTRLGTVGYMSPEQTYGAAVDHRTDLWSLGVVLYEMLAGVRPFRGETEDAVVYAIRNENPAPLETLLPETPPGLRRVVDWCLAKDPESRYASAAALLPDLRSMALEGPVAARADSRFYRTKKVIRRHPFRVAIGVSVAAFFAMGAVTAIWIRRPDLGLNLVVASRAAKVTFEPGLELDPALSPDGDAVAYATGPPSAMRIYLRRRGEVGGTPLSPDSLRNARHPRWSPDGSRIAFHADGSVWVVAASGGEAGLLVEGEATKSVRWLAWSPDGSRIAYVQGGTVWVREITGGEPQRIVRLFDVHGIAWSPDSRWIAYVDGNGAFLERMDTPGDASVNIGNLAPSSVWVVSAGGGKPRRITGDEHLDVSPVWTPDGRTLLFVSSRGGGRDVYGIALDDEVRPTGAPRRLTTGLRAHTISLSAAGGFLSYSSFVSTSNVYSIRIPDGEVLSSQEAEPVTVGNQTVEGVSVSADGKWLAFDSNRLGAQQIFKMALPEGGPVQLTEHSGGAFMPAWSPDGREVAYHAFHGSVRQIHIVSADGTNDRPAFPLAGEQKYPQWAPDGRHLAYHSWDTGEPQLFLLSRNPDSTWRPPELLTLGGETRWSPDGRRLASLAEYMLWIVDVETREVHPLLPPKDASAVRIPFFPLWSIDGQRIYFKAIDTRGNAGIWSVAAEGGQPTLLVRFDDPVRQSNRAELVSDGERFYFTLASLESDIWVLALEGGLHGR